MVVDWRLALLLFVATAWGCAATRSLEPLEKGTGAVTASVGGPINANLGVGIPLPITAIGYVHGLDGKTNLAGAFYPTGLATFGVAGVELEVARELLVPQKARPRIMGAARIYTFFGDNAAGDPPFAARVFPDIAATAVWPIKKHAIYTGLDLFVQPFPSPTAHLTPHVGGQVRFGRTGLSLEYSWWAPYVDNVPVTPVWIGPGGLGASTIQLGLDVRIGPQGD